MNAPETSYGPFRKVGILVEKVGILEETSFGVKNSTVTARSSSPRAKVDSERRSRRQHRIEGTSVRYERAITGDRPKSNAATSKELRRASPDRTNEVQRRGGAPSKETARTCSSLRPSNVRLGPGAFTKVGILGLPRSRKVGILGVPVSRLVGTADEKSRDSG